MTILLTGSSRGIGAAIHQALAATGAAVIGHGTHSGIPADFADPAAPQALWDAALAQAGGTIDALVNNAGVFEANPLDRDHDEWVADWERTMRVNLHGAYFMVQAAANQMVRQGDGGSIIAMSSISALVGGEYQTHYTPTKAGLHSLMQSVAIALGKHKIRCNSLFPGTILTDINKDDLADEGKRSYMEGRIPLGRLGQPDDLVGPTVFLGSDLSDYVTGASLLVDGGAYVNLQ